MPRELRIIEYCDVCLKDDELKVDAVFIDTITIGGVTRDLLLCGPHADKMIGTLADDVANYGNRPSDGPTSPTNGAKANDVPPCPVCKRQLTTKYSLRAHMDSQHNAAINDFFPGYYGGPGGSKVIAPRPAATITVGGRACPHCERVIGGTIGAMHNHVRTKHPDDYPAFLMDHPTGDKAEISRERRAKNAAMRAAQ